MAGLTSSSVLPTDNLNSTIGGVAFPALCRIQHEPQRLRSYFLKGYSLFLSLVMPITMACALFAEDIILVAMGPKWEEAAGIFRLLAPTILVFALINPFAWLMLAVGQAGRSFRISLLIAPVVILGYLVGLTHGPRGVAAGFSIAMMLLVTPVILWAKHGTLITITDVLRALMIPLASAVAAAAVALAFRGSGGSPAFDIAAAPCGMRHPVWSLSAYDASCHETDAGLHRAAS